MADLLNLGYTGLEGGEVGESGEVDVRKTPTPKLQVPAPGLFPRPALGGTLFPHRPVRSESSTPVLLRLHYKCPFQAGGRAAAQGRYPHGLKQQHPEGRKIPECSFYSWTDVAPVQPAEAAAERRDRDRTEVSCADFLNQRRETGLDVLHSALVFPVPLGWEVDHVAGIGEASEVVHHHPAGLDSSPLA